MQPAWVRRAGNELAARRAARGDPPGAGILRSQLLLEVSGGQGGGERDGPRPPWVSALVRSAAARRPGPPPRAPASRLRPRRDRARAAPAGSTRRCARRASRLPSAAGAIVGIHPDAIDASPLQTTSAEPSSAIVPHAWPRPARAANHRVRSSRHSRQLTSSCGASTAASRRRRPDDRRLAREDAPVRAEAFDERDPHAVGGEGRIGDLHRRAGAASRPRRSARSIRTSRASYQPLSDGSSPATAATAPPVQSNSQMFRPSGPAGRVSPLPTSIV